MRKRAVGCRGLEPQPLGGALRVERSRRRPSADGPLPLRGRVEAKRGGVQARRRQVHTPPFRAPPRQRAITPFLPPRSIEPDVTISVIRLSDGLAASRMRSGGREGVSGDATPGSPNAERRAGWRPRITRWPPTGTCSATCARRACPMPPELGRPWRAFLGDNECALHRARHVALSRRLRRHGTVQGIATTDGRYLAAVFLSSPRVRRR